MNTHYPELTKPSKSKENSNIKNLQKFFENYSCQYKRAEKSSNIKKIALLNRVYGEIRSFCSCSASESKDNSI